MDLAKGTIFEATGAAAITRNVRNIREAHRRIGVEGDKRRAAQAAKNKRRKRRKRAEEQRAARTRGGGRYEQPR